MISGTAPIGASVEPYTNADIPHASRQLSEAVLRSSQRVGQRLTCDCRCASGRRANILDECSSTCARARRYPEDPTRVPARAQGEIGLPQDVAGSIET